jgi:hypothetical protein
MRVAFALAGLGGFNAHGAGFLAAATRWNVRPDLVTATSGQILVLVDWLVGADPRTHLFPPAGEDTPLAQALILARGYPGVFRPAYGEALVRLARPYWGKDPIHALADRLLPAQQYVPIRTDADFAKAAETLNGSAIGVVFNSYDPASGAGVLYGNDAARTLLPSEKALPNRHAAELARGKQACDRRYVSDVRAERAIRPITAEAVKSALWLSLYGFNDLPGGQMDGAYHRSCIVSELHGFDRVFVARPLANGWVGRTPQNWFEVQDWSYEMWFSVGYKAEVDAMRRINDLIAAGHLTDPKFKQVELIEIEPETPAGYFHFFVERANVYERAFAIAEETFAQLGLPQPEEAKPGQSAA